MSDKCLIDPERDCYGLIKANELEKDIEALEDDLNSLRKQNSGTHERLFDRLNELERKEGIQGEQYKHIMEKLTQLATDMAEIKARPARRWEGIVEQVIGIVVAAVVGFMLARLGI